MTWEYKVVEISERRGLFFPSLDIEKLNTKLNEFACEGWELITITTTAGSPATSNLLATFKRPKN